MRGRYCAFCSGVPKAIRTGPSMMTPIDNPTPPPPRRPAPRALQVENVALRRRPARPSMLLGPAGDQPALAIESALPLNDVVLLQHLSGDGLALEIGRCVGFEPGANLLLERHVFRAEIDVHRGPFCVRLAL